MSVDKSGQSENTETSTMSMMKRLVRSYLQPYTGGLFAALFFMAIEAAMTAGIAQLMQPVLDKVLTGADKSMIIPIGGAVFLTFLLRGLSTYVHVIIMNKIGQSIVGDIQKDLFRHFMGLDLTFYHANPSGQLISRVVNDVSVVRTAITTCLTGVGKNFLTLIFLMGVMFYQDPTLAIAALGIAPFIGGFVVYIGRRLRKVSRSVQTEMASLSDRLSQIFQGIRQVQAYSMEEAENVRAAKAIDSVRDLNIKSVRIGNMSTPVNEILIGIVAASIIIYGGYQVSSGEMTAGQLVAFLAAFTMAYEPMKKLARLNNAVQTGLGAGERIFNMLDTPTQIHDKADAKTLQLSSAEIKFENVGFSYKAEDGKALDDVSFTAQAGKVTALVGASGGGKTTVINMIPRFYDAQSGRILITDHGETADGGAVDLRDISLRSLRKHISLVSQDITIFDDTIAANIAYGRPDATREEVVEAARQAAAHDFISAFPEGYDTRTGEDGVKLSGGQRQRIAIARALLHDTPILLLDEATSALDNESEKLVQGALKALEKGRTTIVIAHRLSTVREADQIIVLEKGRVIERGTHDELIAKNGAYARMVEAGLRE